MQMPIFVLMMLCILPILCGWVSGYYRHKQFGVVDNKYPRLQNAQLEQAGARAVAAQMNAWEALALYSAALLAVNIAEIPVEQYATYCLVLLACRILHALFYLLNQDVLRSISFVAAFGINIYMFILAL